MEIGISKKVSGSGLESGISPGIPISHCIRVVESTTPQMRKTEVDVVVPRSCHEKRIHLFQLEPIYFFVALYGVRVQNLEFANKEILRHCEYVGHWKVLYAYVHT
jgi:hypothetical protein